MLTSLFSLVFSILIFGGIINAIQQMSRGGASRNWSTTSGQVIHSSIRQEHGGPYYFLVVKYRYTVEEQEYESSRIRFAWAENGYSFRQAEEIINNTYPVSKTIKVYYNPKTPSVSVLVPGVVPNDYVSAVVGFLVLGWMIFSLSVTRSPTTLQPPENNFDNGAWSDDP